MKVDVLSEYGHEEALFGIGLSYGITSDTTFNDMLDDYFQAKGDNKREYLDSVAHKLCNKEGGHNKFLESMMVWLDIDAPRYWHQELDTYRAGTTKQSECYDNITEVLTNNGWKLFKNLLKEDLICTLNPDTKEIEYQLPTSYINEDFNGNMISLKSNKYDLLVTPNHKIPIRNNYKDIELINAENFKSHHKIIKNIHKWNGIEKDFFTLPKLYLEWDTGFRLVEKEYEELDIKMDDWLSFFGIWLAEGRTSKEKRNYNTYIYQNNDNKCYEELSSLFDKLPFKYHKQQLKKNMTRWVISNRQLYEYLSALGDTYTKYIPNEYMSLSCRQLNILLKWMMNGDGTDYYEKNYTYLYSTASKKLADNVQELFLKTGNISNIYMRKDNRSKKYCDIYTVNRSTTSNYQIQKNNITNLVYNDKIYCVDVPNHIIMVRRNGKITWSGNSTIHTITKRHLTQDNFEEPILDSYLEYLNNLIDIGASKKEIKNALPEGFLQRRIVCTNYKTLRNICHQRKNHAIDLWNYFIKELKSQLDFPEFLE